MPFSDFEIELLRKWVQSLLSTLNTSFDRETQAGLLESCGKSCALHHGDLVAARGLGRRHEDMDSLVAELNRQVDWCGEWTNDGDAIRSICETCGCPLVRGGLVKLSPAFCECSRGFVSALFEEVFEEPASVDLARAIGRGDPVCEFVVRCGGNPAETHRAPHGKGGGTDETDDPSTTGHLRRA